MNTATRCAPIRQDDLASTEPQIGDAGSDAKTIEGGEARPTQLAKWYLVNAQTGREMLAELHLKRQAYETFLPRSVRTIGKGRRSRRAIVSYFPGYLFVRLDISAQRWRPIDSTVGVMRIIKVGEIPSPAPNGLIEGIRDLVGEAGLYEPAPPELSVGENVKIVHGPFAAHLAVVERLDGPGRVRVLLTLMKQSIPISMSAADLVAA